MISKLAFGFLVIILLGNAEGLWIDSHGSRVRTAQATIPHYHDGRLHFHTPLEWSYHQQNQVVHGSPVQTPQRSIPHYHDGRLHYHSSIEYVNH